ncbi:MAG: D-glycero-beta-D-manno-heptose 1-phosphate adenylyltransferase [Calditrichaeota bacterium]|nr:MAG: D-glycero-beta-D-manno-heptose 1-phosphate adenylyltransferase [Calditrichota bacterium]
MHLIVSRNEIADAVDSFREENPGSKIVFTNGCFDILHRGHVTYLEQARALGNLLVLGLNSDASVRRLKGAPRPYMHAEDRAFLLSRLEMVDMVSVFEEDTPLELIRLVRPDILVKGGDYTPDTVIGKDFVEQQGGRVVIIPFVLGLSTTNIINKIKES